MNLMMMIWTGDLKCMDDAFTAIIAGSTLTVTSLSMGQIDLRKKYSYLKEYLMPCIKNIIIIMSCRLHGYP